jgi:hypothetical protein
MNESSHTNSDLGSLTRPVSASLGPLTVDCSSWDADIPPDRWSTGKLASVPRVAQQGSQGAFIPAESLDLEIALRILPGANASEALEIATTLFAAILMHDLGHGLVYDRARSGAKEDRFVIVLTPGQSGPSAEARLEMLAEVIRYAMREATGIALSEVRIRRAA